MRRRLPKIACAPPRWSPSPAASRAPPPLAVPSPTSRRPPLAAAPYNLVHAACRPDPRRRHWVPFLAIIFKELSRCHGAPLSHRPTPIRRPPWSYASQPSKIRHLCCVEAPPVAIILEASPSAVVCVLKVLLPASSYSEPPPSPPVTIYTTLPSSSSPSKVHIWSSGLQFIYWMDELASHCVKKVVYMNIYHYFSHYYLHSGKHCYVFFCFDG